MVGELFAGNWKGNVDGRRGILSLKTKKVLKDTNMQQILTLLSFCATAARAAVAQKKRFVNSKLIYKPK